jgi:hypothetical protein
MGHDHQSWHPDLLEAYQDFKLQLEAKGEDNIRENVINGADRPILTPNQFPYWTRTLGALVSSRSDIVSLIEQE